MQTTASGLYTYHLQSESSPFRSTLEVVRVSEDVEIVRLTITSDTPAIPPVFTLKWTHPIVDVQGLWHPTAVYNKWLRADWSTPLASYSTYSAPVACLFSGTGRNRLTFAYSDVLNLVKYDAGVNEESSTFACYISLFDTPTSPISHYEAELRVDTRDIAYYEALDEVSRWWASFESNLPAEVPPEAIEPMYSTWYTFHQRLRPEAIEEQCILSRSFGIRSVIVDDGWQTSDNERGYAYCGDWLACEEKMPDMRAHVDRVHGLGMKYLLWYSVPFVGYKSPVWDQFKDKMLFELDYLSTGVLDPRFPEVREHLIGTYEKAMRDWDLDGLKLDFVDIFRQPENDKATEGDGRDYLSVPQAVDVLLSEVISRLKAIKPGVMIEFRQNYISPLMRKYGNLFRAADCPNDAIQNRVRTIDVRLLCGNTAAHSDMIMWNPDEPAESAALQLINILFAVPQISVALEKLPEAHASMLRFWLSFWREHRDVLLDGKLMPEHPELLYPCVQARNQDCLIAALYADSILRIAEDAPGKLIIINGTRGDRILMETPPSLGNRSVRIMNCAGDTVTVYPLPAQQTVQTLAIPPGGLAVLTASDPVQEKGN